MMKLKLYQHDEVKEFKQDYSGQYQFFILPEKDFKICRVMNVLGWKELYEF
jgi:hypothetical protein